MKILVLTSSTGGGHNMRARSLQQWAEVTPDLDIQVRIEHVLENSHPLYKFGVNFYNFIQKYAPWFHHIYFNYLEVSHTTYSSKTLLGADHLKNILNEYQPDVIVSTHAHLNHAFFEVAKQTLPHVKCVTYCGELSGGYGFSKHWVNPAADLFIAAVDECYDAAIKHGMPPAKTWTGGFLLNPTFFNPPIQTEIKIKFLQSQGFNPNLFTLVLSTGAVGANNHMPLLEELEAVGFPIQVIALCGKNEKSLAQIEKWKDKTGFAVVTFPYTDQMPLIMESASAIVARPGTGTTSEAIVCGCPIIHNGIGGVMPQENITLEFCKKYQLSEVIHSPFDILSVIKKWIDQPHYPVSIRNSMGRIIPQKTPVDILEKLKNLAAQ